LIGGDDADGLQPGDVFQVYAAELVQLEGPVGLRSPLHGLHFQQCLADTPQVIRAGVSEVRAAGDGHDRALERALHVSERVKQPGVTAAAQQERPCDSLHDQRRVVPV